MSRRNLFFGIGAISSFILAIYFIILLVQQQGVVASLRQQFYNQKITTQQEKIETNLAPIISAIKDFSKNGYITEIFTQKFISLSNIPVLNHLDNIKTVRITDELGRIVFTSGDQQEINKQISQNITLWSNSSDYDIQFFLLDQDTLIAVSKYDNPYSINHQGYIIVEFSTMVLFKNLNIPHYYVRIVSNNIPLLILGDTSNISIDFASDLALKYCALNIELSDHQGRLLNIPNLGKVLYYIGDSLYYPLIIITIIIFLLIIGIILMIAFYIRKKNHKITDNDTAYSHKITQLIQDIENGHSYKFDDIDDIVENASKYGVSNLEEKSEIITEEEHKENFEKIDENPEEIQEEFFEDNISIVDYDNIDDEYLQEESHDIIPDSTDEIPIEDIYIPHFALGVFDNEKVQQYTDSIAEFFKKYQIKHYAVSEEKDGIFVFENSNLGIDFIIDSEDPLFKEVLSKGEVLSVEGDLAKSSYLENLFTSDVLNRYGELFIRPILDQNDVKGIVVLTRDKGMDFLTHQEKKELFIDHY